MEIKDEAGFVATLTDPAQKAWYENALKTAGTTAVDKFKADDAAARKAKIPEKYEFKLAADSPFTAEDTAKFAEYAKAAGYTSEDAQKLVDVIQERFGALNTRQQDLIRREIAGWTDQVKVHKKLGGDNFKKTEANIKRVLDKFAPQADHGFRKLLNDTGYGNHPAVVEFVSDIGAAMGEGGTTRFSEGGGEGEMTFTEALYGKQSA